MNDNINVNVSGPVQPASTYKTKVLKGNHSFASQVTEPNMKYVIKHDFDLGGGSVTIPEGCLLEFDGGSLSNGTIEGQNTGIDAGLVTIFDKDIALVGSWNIAEAYTEWFGASTTLEDNSEEINNAIKICSNANIKVLCLNGIYKIKDTILLRNLVSIKGRNLYDREKDGYPTTTSMAQAIGYTGFLYNFDTNPNNWVIDHIRTSSDDSEHTLPYNKLWADYSDTGTWRNNRFYGLTIENVSILADSNATKLAFGGIRLPSINGSTIRNIQICETAVGICINECWGNYINNIKVFCRLCGFYIGWHATMVVFDSIAIDTAVNSTITNSHLITDFDVLSLSELLPPYVNIESVGYMIETTGPSEDTTQVFVSHSYIQNKDAIACTGINTVLNYNENACEQIEKTLFWTYAGTIIINQLTNLKITTSYNFGTNSGLIEANGVYYGTCYTPSNVGNKVLYRIQGSKIFYYDDWTIENNRVVSATKSPNKLIIVDDDTYVVNNTVFEITGRYIFNIPQLAAPRNRCSIQQVLDLKKQGIILLEVNNLSLNGTTFDGKNYTIKSQNTGTIYMRGTQHLINSKLDFGNSNVSIGKDSETLGISGFCELTTGYVINGNGSNDPFLTLEGNEPINLVLHNYGWAKTSVSRIITNPDYGTKYNITVYNLKPGEESIKHYTNTTRPTTGNTKGDVYVENGIPIFWTGDTSGGKSGWVDATGATV